MSENQAAANQAIADIASIEDMIRSAAEKSAEARNAMAGADGSANLALTVALEAQKIASEASEKAEEISTESGNYHQ